MEGKYAGSESTRRRDWRGLVVHLYAHPIPLIHGGVNILNVDVTIAGGVTEWRRMAALASHFHVEMAHHEESQISLHLLASIPHGLYVGIFPNPKRDPLWFELPVECPRIRNGFMELPSGPGLGMDLNEDVIARYRAD